MSVRENFKRYAGLASSLPTLAEARELPLTDSPPEELIGNAQNTIELATLDSVRAARLLASEMKLGLGSRLVFQDPPSPEPASVDPLDTKAHKDALKRWAKKSNK